jgi:hypothetical protein
MKVCGCDGSLVFDLMIRTYGCLGFEDRYDADKRGRKRMFPDYQGMLVISLLFLVMAVRGYLCFVFGV